MSEQANKFKEKYGWTVYDFLLQLDDYVVIPSSVLSQAKASSLTTGNNKRLKFLFDCWIKGKYDNHVDTLLKEITKTLNK